MKQVTMQSVMSIKPERGGFNLTFSPSKYGKPSGVFGRTVDETMDLAADSVKDWKEETSTKLNRINEIQNQINRLQALQREIEAQPEEDHAIDSLLDPMQLDILKRNIKCLDIDVVNWYKQKYNATVIGIEFYDRPTLQGTRLVWGWTVHTQ